MIREAMIVKEKKLPRYRDRVFARVCDKCGSERTYVYKTNGRTRYCKCDVCSSTWKQAK